MRRRISKLAGIAAVASTLAVGTAVGVATAQDVERPMTTDRVGDRDDGMGWGWIGLLGLARLAGLMGSEKHATYRSPQTQTTANRV